MGQANARAALRMSLAGLDSPSPGTLQPLPAKPTGGRATGVGRWHLPLESVSPAARTILKGAATTLLSRPRGKANGGDASIVTSSGLAGEADRECASPRRAGTTSERTSISRSEEHTSELQSLR